MTMPFSLRLPARTLERLQSRSRASGQPPRTMAQRYVEEGIRHDDHPLIHFVDGPAGRRPAVLGTGLDVWEVAATVKDNGGDGGEAADYLAVPRHVVDAAIAYYGAYREEVDEWIIEAHRVNDEAHAAWRAGHEAVSG